MTIHELRCDNTKIRSAAKRYSYCKLPWKGQKAAPDATLQNDKTTEHDTLAYLLNRRSFVRPITEARAGGMKICIVAQIELGRTG